MKLTKLQKAFKNLKPSQRMYVNALYALGSYCANFNEKLYISKRIDLTSKLTTKRR